MCCRRGWSGKGCDGKIGGQKKHLCVKRTGMYSILTAELIFTDFAFLGEGINLGDRSLSRRIPIEMDQMNNGYRLFG